MRNIIQETMYFSFRDIDGALSFTLNAYDGEPDSPRFLFDGNQNVFFMRRAGQVVSLDNMQDDLTNALKSISRVRIVETPEDSSEILRQYDVPVTVIEPICAKDHLLSEQEICDLLPQIA